MRLNKRGQAETLGTEANTAAAMGSGSPPVFTAPVLIALTEQAAVAEPRIPRL
jgi:predicted thioesterase